MRLLHVHRLEFEEHYSTIPRYAIASHRWKRGTEASTGDFRNKCNANSEGYRKVLGFAEYVKTNLPHVEWLWIDTCCINQESSQEVTEAINSMFEYYRNAEVCLAYLFDVSGPKESIRGSDWFARGWTLQELLAPCTVVFLTENWQVIGHKGATGRSKTGVKIDSGRSLTSDIVAATGIAEEALENFKPSSFSIEEKMAWTSGRSTMREEDMSYCLFGIFDVSLPVLYGEGKEKARKRLFEEVNKGSMTAPQMLKPVSKPSSNVPFRRDPDFIDRGPIIDSMSRKLALPAGRAALVGLGGAGKSQLAIEYAYRMRRQQPGTWLFWIYAANVARFEQGMRDIADEAKIEGQEDANVNIFKLVRDWLRESANGPWVLVLDNVDDASFLERRPSAEKDKSISPRNSLFDYLPICDHGSILITSRDENAALKLVAHADIIEINPMDEASAVTLLQTKLARQESEEDIAELAMALEYLPLAITQAASYINQRGRRCSVREYRTKLQACGDLSNPSVLGFEAGDIRRDEDAQNSILRTWQISFEHIYRTRRSAAELLSLMSFCDRQAIPKLLLRTGNTDENASQTPDHSRPLKRKFGDEDALHSAHPTSKHANTEENFDDDLALLEGFSFVSVTTNDSTFQMHRLVQLSTRSWLESHGQLEQWRDQYVNNLADVFPSGDYETWTACQTLFPHAKLTTLFKLENEHTLLQWARLMHCASWFACGMKNLNEAEEMATLSLDTRVRILGKDNEITLRSMTNLALALVARGRLTESIEIEREAFEISEKVLGREHPETLIRMSNLAASYLDLGRMEEASVLHREVLEKRRRVMGDRHPHSLDDLDNLGNRLGGEGRLSEAEKLYLGVIEIRKEVQGEEHPDTIQSTAYLVWILRKQERYSEAEELARGVLKMRKKVLGEYHRETLDSMAEIFNIYRSQGRVQEAIEAGTEVFAIRQKVLGEEHPRTLTSLDNLLAIYMDEGLLSEAEAAGEKLLMMRRKVLGESDPSTVNAMINLALVYSKQGRLEEAEKLEVSSLEISKRERGEEHRDTLTSMYNLSITRKELGQIDEAVLLLSHCLAISTRVFGVDHSRTMEERETLESWTKK